MPLWLAHALISTATNRNRAYVSSCLFRLVAGYLLFGAAKCAVANQLLLLPTSTSMSQLSFTFVVALHCLYFDCTPVSAFALLFGPPQLN